jgi:hypothetical protein
MYTESLGSHIADQFINVHFYITNNYYMKYLGNAWDMVIYGPSIHAQLLLTELKNGVVNTIHAEMQ